MQNEALKHTNSQIQEFERVHLYKDSDYWKSMPIVDKKLASITTLKNSKLDSSVNVFEKSIRNKGT